MLLLDHCVLFKYIRKLWHFLVLLGAFKGILTHSCVHTAFKIYSTTDGRVRHMRSTNAFYTQPDIRGQHWVVNYRILLLGRIEEKKQMLLFCIALFDYYTVHHNCVMRTLLMTKIVAHTVRGLSRNVDSQSILWALVEINIFLCIGSSL